MLRHLASLLILVVSTACLADLRLPALFSDHMVLQQRTSAPIWGWGDPGEIVTISASWGAATSASADSDGRWETTIETPKAGGPYELTVSGSNSIELHDVMIGEVWFCAGQSNMEFSLNADACAMNEALAPGVRLFHVARQYDTQPDEDVNARWSSCTPQSARDFSAVAFYFGRKLSRELNVPIGLIECAWGGSPIEAWMNPLAVKSILPLGEQPPENESQNQESAIYNGMIEPIIPFAIKGVIWYQGESNVQEPMAYQLLFRELIRGWRAEWNEGSFPFYFVQIAPFDYKSGENAARLREAQARALLLRGTGMVITMDIAGNVHDIHPRNKLEVGDRLARWALAKTYGAKVCYCGPTCRGYVVEGNRIRIFFSHTEGGLVSKSGALTDFQIAGSNRQFLNGVARISGNTVVVSSPDVKRPVAVRFAFSDTAEPNLYNGDGLPAAPFRTDKW